MKSNPLFIVAILIGILFSVSCKKANNAIYIPPATLTPNKPDTVDTREPELKDFFSGTREESQSFTGTAENGIHIKGKEGTEIVIYASSLLHQNDDLVTGDVEIQLIEIYTPGKMILANAVTISGNSLLQSGGEIYIMAWQNGERLKINPNKPMAIGFPAPANPLYDMQLFKGNFQGDPNSASDSTMNWTIGKPDTASVQSDSSSTEYTYIFHGTDLGWVNCDRYPNAGGSADFTVKVPDGFDNKNTSVFIVFNDYNSVAPASIYKDGTFKLWNGEKVGEGLSITVVAIAKKDDKFYYKIEHRVTTPNDVIEIAMDEATEDEIKAAVEVL